MLDVDGGGGTKGEELVAGLATRAAEFSLADVGGGGVGVVPSLDAVVDGGRGLLLELCGRM